MQSGPVDDVINDEIEPYSSFWYDTAAAGACIGILILALSIGHLHQIGAFGEETDFYHAYGPQTDRILKGQPPMMEGNNSPGYVYLLAGVTWIVGGDSFQASKILAAFATGLLGWITYLLFKALFGVRVALASTILLLIPLIPYSYLAATDMVGTTLVMIPLWIFLRRPNPTLSACVVTGLFSGFAYVTRNPTMFVIVGLGFSMLFLNVSNHKTLQQRFWDIGLFIIGVLLAASPWIVISWTTNESTFSSSSYLQIAAHFYLGTNFGSALPKLATQFHSLWDVLLYNPALILRKYLAAVSYWNLQQLPDLFLQFPAYLFAGAGCLFLFRDLTRKTGNLVRRRLTYLSVIFFGYLLLGLVGFMPRYYLFLVPFLFLLVPYFLFHESVLLVLGNIPFTRIHLGWLVVLILAAFLGLNVYHATTRFLASEPRHLYDMAEILKKRSSPDDVIIDRKPHLGYLTGLTSANDFSSPETAEEWYEKASEMGARYIVYSDLYASRYWPGLKSLSNPTILPSNFQLIYRHEPTNTLMYEIDGSDRQNRNDETAEKS